MLTIAVTAASTTYPSLPTLKYIPRPSLLLGPVNRTVCIKRYAGHYPALASQAIGISASARFGMPAGRLVEVTARRSRLL